MRNIKKVDDVMIIRSIKELNNLAKSYKTKVNNLILNNLEKNTLDTYEITNDSKEAFDNIIKFYLNCTVKDSEYLDGADDAISSTFAELLKNYYEKGLSNEEIIQLLCIVAKYNQDIDKYLNENPLSIIYEAVDGKDGYYKGIQDVIFAVFNEASYKSKGLFDTLMNEENIRDLSITTKGNNYYFGKTQLKGIKEYDSAKTNFTDYYVADDSGIPYYSCNDDKIYGLLYNEYHILTKKYVESDNVTVRYVKQYLTIKVNADGKYFIIDEVKNILGHDIDELINKIKEDSSPDNIDLKCGETYDDSNKRYYFIIQNDEVLFYETENEEYNPKKADFANTGYYIKKTFKDWIDMTIPSYSMDAIFELYNPSDRITRFELVQHLNTLNFDKFAAYIHLLKEEGKLNNATISITNSNESETPTYKYIVDNNVRKVLYEKIGSGENDYIKFNFTPKYTKATINYSEKAANGKDDNPSLILSKTTYDYSTDSYNEEDSNSVYILMSDGSYAKCGRKIINNIEYFKEYSSLTNNDEWYDYIDTKLLNLITSFKETDSSSFMSNINSITEEISNLAKIIEGYIKISNELLFYGPTAYSKLIKNKSKIQQLITPKGQTKTNEPKNIADIDEISNAQDNCLISGFNLMNIIFTQSDINTLNLALEASGVEKEAINEVISSIKGNTISALEVDKSPIYITSIGVVYKELNKLYRDIEYSDLVELVMQLIDESGITIFNDVGTHIVNGMLDAAIREYNANSKSIINSDFMSLVGSLYINPYIARRARESDIIQYFSGPFIEYGINGTEKNEIQLFMSLYQETRDFYYRNLLNKSFTQDQYYGPYERTYIAIFAIERYISSKIDNVHDIDYFDKNDIHNFLISYGLDVLDKSDVFYGADDYKKRIIKNFNSLIKSKGSSDVIGKLINILSDDEVEIDIKKYLLAETQSLNINFNSDKIDLESTDLYGSNKYFITIYDDSYKDIYEYQDVDSSWDIDDDGAAQPITRPSDYNEKFYSKINRFGEGVLIKDNSSDIISNVSKFPVKVSTINIKNQYNTDNQHRMILDLSEDNKKSIIYRTNDDRSDYLSNRDTIGLRNFLYQFDESGNIYYVNSRYKKITVRYTNKNKSETKILFTENCNSTGAIEYVNYNLYLNTLTINYKINEENKQLITQINNTDDNIQISFSEYIDTKTYCGVWTPIVEQESDSDVKFIEISYATDNETLDILKATETAEEYSDFVESDLYWDSSMVRKEDILDLNINTTTTKYSVFDFSKNISEAFIKSRYVLSLIDYLRDKLLAAPKINTKNASDSETQASENNTSNDNSNEKNILNNIYIGISGIPEFSQNSLSLPDLFTLIGFMYKSLIRATMEYYGINYKNSNTVSPMYYGFNKSATFSSVFEDTQFKPFLSSVFTRKIYTGNEVSPHTKTIFSPYEEKNGIPNAFTNETLYFKADSTKLSFEGDSFASIFDEVGNDTSALNGRSSYGEIFKYLLSINYLSLMNEDNSNETENILRYPAWGYYKTKLTDNILSSSANSITNMSDHTESIYYNIIDQLIQFPLDYLGGLKNPDSFNLLCINKNFVDMIDLLFNNFYMTDSDITSYEYKLTDAEISMFEHEGYDPLFKYATDGLFVYNNVEDSEHYKELTLTASVDELKESFLKNTLSNNLLSLLEDIAGVFEAEPFLQLKLELSQNTTNMVNFMLAAIKMFISYTSEIHEIRTTESYMSRGEYASPNDDVVIDSKDNMIDGFYNDSKVIVKDLTKYFPENTNS